MTIMEKKSDMQEMTSTVICGHFTVVVDQAGKPFLAGRCFVALKILKVVLNIDRTINEHEKLTPLSTIFAILTRVFTFCLSSQHRTSWLSHEHLDSPGLSLVAYRFSILVSLESFPLSMWGLVGSKILLKYPVSSEPI